MAKKTFVNPFATVGFNQGNYTPYEQQNLLDAEENDRLYQEYLNSGMAQQGFQPQDNSSAIGRGLTAGAAGVIEGQAQLANLMGIGDGQMVQYLQKINRNNARKKEYSIADMIPFASDYWTNTEGAAYDVANMLGSSGAMMAETAALMTGAGAIGGALGLGGGAAAAGSGFAGALSRGAGLAPNAVKKLAEKMAAAANNRGYTKLGKALEGPMGQMYALNILKTPIEVSSEAGSAGADALAEGADVWEARKRAGITALVQAPLLAMSNTIESANLGGLFSKEIGKKATKEAIISLLGDITKDGLQNAWEEGMQQSSQEYAAGKQSLLGVVNPFQWSPEALQEAAVGAVGGMALGGGNAMLGTVAGGRETQKAPNQEQPTQEAAPVAPTPTGAVAEEQVIDTDKITPKGARAFLENAQSEMPAGEEYNAITELLDTGSDADIISKATSMGYGKKETPVKQEQPAQPVEQQVEQQAAQPVVAPAPVEDWATAQINEAIAMIPTQARAKLMNKDGSINWDKVNSDQNVQKALNNSKGIETAIKAINGDEKARNTMKGWGAKKKAAIIHAAQQQIAGQENVQQPAKPVKPVEQPAPKPEAKPAPQGDEQNAQGQNQNNGDQNQDVNTQPQQPQTPEADNQGQGQNGQVETVKPSSAPVQQFKDTLGDYVVDEYGFNNDNTRSYVHKADDGKDVQRVATIQRTKDGKYSASKNSSDKMAEPKVFDTLEEAEAFIAGKKPSKPTTKTTAAKPEPKKEVKPEPAPESKPPTVAEDDINIDEVNKRVADRIERNRAENAPMGALAAEKQEAEDADKKLNKLRNKPRGSILSALVNGSSMHKFKDALLQRYYQGWTPADVTIKGLEAVLNGDAVKGLPEAAQKLAKKYIRGMIDRVKEYDKAHPEHAQKIADYQKEQGGLRTDENGIVLLSTTMNAEEAKAQREANDKVLLAKGEEIKRAYIRDTMTADEARAAITALTSKYNKIKNMPPVSKDALKKLANIRSWILSDNKERSKGVKLTDKERAESMLEDAQEEIDKAFKVYGGVGVADKEAISAYESLKKNIQTAKVVFYSNLESEGLKPLKKYEKVFKDAFDKVNGMIDKAGDKKDYEAFKSMLDKAIERAFNDADNDVMLPSTLKEMLENSYAQYWKELSKFAKWKDSEHFPLSDKTAYEAHKAATMERFKEYEKQYNETHQQGGQQQQHQEQQEQAQQQSNNVDEFRVLKRMATSAPFSATLKAQLVYEARELKKDAKELLEYADEGDYKYGESWGEFAEDFEDYLRFPKQFLEEKLKEKGLPHVAEYDAIIEQYAKAIEQIKNNTADQLKGMFPNVTPIEVNTVEQQQAPSAEQDAQEGESNIGAYADSVLGEGFMADFKAQLAAAKKEEAKNKKSTKKSEPSPTDQDIENDILEQQIAEQVDANDTVFAQIELAIDSISNSKEQGAARKFFDSNPEARNLVAERIKKGAELFRVKYQTKSGKDISEYYVKEADSDNYVKVPKSEAIVMSKVGKLEIKETTKDAMGKEKKAKYVTEISEDEDWEYADALEEGKIEGVKKGDKKAVNIIMDFLTIEFADGKGCPFDKTVKTWAEWVRKVALFDAERKNEGLSLDALWSEDNPAKLNVGQKDYLNDFYEYLYKKYESKVEDKSRQKKNLEADMVEKPTQTVEAKQEIEVPAEQKAKDEAKQRAAEALKAAFANAKFKTTQVNKNDLDNFDSNVIKQIIKSGYIVLNDVGEKIYDGWKQTMTSVIDGLEDLALKYKNYAKRILDSVWDYLSNLPDKVSFAADKLEKTLTNIAASLDMALDLQSSGFSYRDAINLLKSSNQKVYNRFKDYLGAAFRAIERYPRKNDIGGDINVDVRAPEQSAQGNSGRGNGNGLEANSGNNGRGNQMGGGQTTQGETNQEFNQRPVQEESGTPISGSGSAAGRKQGYQQGGTQKSNDSASVSGNSNGGRGSRTGQNGSAGNSGGLEQNLSQAQRNAKKQADAAAGKRLSELQFNKEPFKAADEQGIAKAVPTLLPEQLKDVVAIEKRLFKNNGKGMLVANGTGTGKTMTGLGEIVRFLQKGARKILIVVPSSNIRDNWVDDGAKVGLPSSAFATITTGKVAPDAINIITYKAFSENQNILKESWDLVVMDECQWVSSGAKSDENERTNTAQTLRAISGHERTGFEDYMQSKYRKEYRELKKLGDKLKKSRKALGNLVAQFGAFGQPVNQLKANIKSMEDKQKALRRKLDIAEQKERKEYDKRLLARKEDTRVLLLSATPFAYSNSIYYAEGLLFNYDKGSYEDYMVDQFGYERKQDGTVRIQRVMGTSIPMPNHILEAKWHDMLVDSGAMINRRLEIQQDYNRRFVKVDGGIGAEIDKGFEVLKDYRKGDLNQILAERFDYSKRCRLLEAIKADAAIPMIKEYLKQGKKVVIFHDYKSEEPVGHPFKLYQEELAELSQDARDEYERLRKEHPELFLLEVNAFHNVDQTLEQAFKGKMAAINGNISFDKRTQIVKAFNNDNSGLDIVSVVAEAGKEGISLHDTTGEHPRVLINLGMPTRPTSSIQIEGRIYRLGQKSNAQLRYLYTDTKIEQKAFVDYISARTRTAETLALGDASRNLDGAFAIGYLASKTEKGDFNAANDTVDTGGKLYDTMSKEELETSMKQMYEQLNADGAVDEDMKAKLAERIQELEDERNAKKREEILTEQNEKKLLATIKEAVAGNKVTKVADGVYVVEFVGGARNLWIDLNNSQAAILGQMTEEQKRSMLSAARIKGSEYEIGGYYTKEANGNIGAVVDIIRLTEVATTHTLDHETMHFVHNVLLKTLEKQHLEKYFKMLLKKQIGEDAYNKLNEKERLAQCEEMEADAYAAFCAEDRKPKNMVERFFWKMQKWLAQFAEKFGIETPMGIYIRVRSGEMYGRGPSIATQDDLVNAKSESPARYQAAGVKAKTADLNKLSVAEDMEKRGMTRERIFDKTGWWRGEDGKWRFEIKDDIGKIKTGELLFGEDDRMPLGELYDNEDLYRAYPQLKNVVVQLKSLDDNVGGYASKAKNIIAINSSDAEDFESDVSDWKNGITRALKINAKGIRGNIDAYLEGKTISREIDKAIRQSGSSFSEDTFATALHRVNNIVKKLPEYTFDDEVTNEDYIFNGIRFYYTRFNSLEEEMRLTLVHEIQHFVQGFEQHGRGSGVEHARTTAQVREIARILKTSKFPSVTKAAILYVRGTHLRLEKVEFEALQSEFDDIIANMSKEEFQEANRIIEAIGNASDAVFKRESIDYYYDFAGEREARQASSMAKTNYIKDLYHALDFRRYPWQHLDELRTGKVQVDFGELLKVEDTIYGEEQLDGTIKFSVKPVDKIDGKGVPDNLDNVVDNKESLEDVKPYGSVQETLQEAQKLGEKDEEEGGIVVKEPKVDKSRDIGALDTYLHSPSHLAKKNPIFKAFYDIFKKAQSVQEKLRNRWLGQLDGAYKMLKSKEDADTYHNLMVDGELKAKEYSMQELADMGVKDNVAKAYLHTRQMIRNIWEKVNDAHRGLVYRTEKLSAKKVEELSKKPFIENIMVRVVKIGIDNTDAYQPLSEVKLNDKATYEVKYGQPHVFKDTKILTQEQLDELKANPYAHVVKEEEYKEVEGLKLLKAEVENVAPPIGKIAGYLPHIFEQWLVLVETEQGSVPVGSGKNVKEAVKIAESLQKDAPNVQFYIVPKMFNPSNVLGEDVAEGSVGGASIVLSAEDFSRLEKSISNTFKMSLAEAREALKPVAKKEGKSRFLGSLLHRKGRVGYNTDIADSLSRYIYMTSRYVALQPAKVKAFSLFERTFHGTLGEDYSRTDQLAHVTKNYILHCNGTPNHLETLLTGWLNMIPFWRNYVSSNFGDRSLMSITGRVNGLLSMSLLGGYNISSAVVGLSQLANVYARIGSRFLGEGMYAYKRMNLRDKRILAETGILYDIGLDTASGFTKRRKLLGGEGDSGLAKAYKFVAYYGDKGMYFFKKADEATRGIAALGAYYKGIEDGMSHKQAIAYAKKVNRDSNFDYGAADAPAIYQRLSGTGIGDLMLLFQKYPIKQFEFMQQMLPYFGSAKKAEKIRFWGAYFLMAGLAGIPLGDWLDELLAKVLGYKPTTAVKSYLFTEFGDNIGTRTLAYGALSNLGVDVSRRIGMANLAPQGDSVWETALGPGLNILYRMAQSGSDDWAKTIKAFNPSLGNMAEGIRGYKTNSKNQINYIYGDMEKFFKAAGFRTTGESIAGDLQSAVYLDKQQKKDARQKVLMEMVKKRLDGETLTNEDYKALREQKITPEQLKKAVSDAKMTALQRTRAGMTKQQKKDFAGTIVMEDDE